VADPSPVARSPISPAPPVVTLAGWEVSARRSTSPLRLIDCTPYTKILVRADPESPWAQELGIERGRVKPVITGALVAASGLGEWLIIAPPGQKASSLANEMHNGAQPPISIDLTHARAMIQITGEASEKVLSKLCGIDFRNSAAPNNTALRSSVALLVTEIIRHDIVWSPVLDQPDQSAASRSYLLLCARSAGQYLFDVLLDAGQEYGIDIEGIANIVPPDLTG
jgi:sarcosine oxidase gamma subunit